MRIVMPGASALFTSSFLSWACVYFFRFLFPAQIQHKEDGYGTKLKLFVLVLPCKVKQSEEAQGVNHIMERIRNRVQTSMENQGHDDVSIVVGQLLLEAKQEHCSFCHTGTERCCDKQQRSNLEHGKPRQGEKRAIVDQPERKVYCSTASIQCKGCGKSMDKRGEGNHRSTQPRIRMQAAAGCDVQMQTHHDKRGHI
jgi:hypothetical protein